MKHFIYLLLLLFITSCSDKSKTTYTHNNDSEVIKKFIESIDINLNDTNLNKTKFIEDKISKLKNFKDYGNLYNQVGQFFYINSDFYTAKYFYTKSKNFFLITADTLSAAKQISNIGAIFEVTGDYKNAIKNYYLALEIFKANNEEVFSSKIYNNLGIVYQQLNENKKSLEYYHKSLYISEKLGKHNISAIRYNNIATLYEDSENNIDSALFYYNKALNIWKNDSNSNNLGIVLNNIGYVYLLKNNIKKADSLFEESLVISNNNNDNNNKSFILRNKALLLIKKADYINAISYLKESILIAKDIKNKEAEMKSLKVLADAYELNNEYKLANSTLKELNLLNDELSGIKQKSQINKLNIQYSVREKENRIKILELKNNVQDKKIWQLWLLISALTFLLTGVFVIYRLQKKNSKLEMQQMRRDIADYLSQIEEIKENQNINIENKQKDIIKKLKQYGLTETEEKVLLLISKGYKNIEIAEKMFVSINTIKTHTKNIFIKLDVRNRIEAARKAQII